MAGACNNGRPDGNVRVGLDFEFAATLAQFDVALFYGLVLPIVLPIAALSMATHWAVFSFLHRERGVRVLPCASPPVSYLQATILLQAMLATWFFSAVEGIACGAAVGIATLPAALCWLCGTRGTLTVRRTKVAWPIWLRERNTSAPGRASTALGLTELQDGTRCDSKRAHCADGANISTDVTEYALMDATDSGSDTCDEDVIP